MEEAKIKWLSIKRFSSAWPELSHRVIEAPLTINEKRERDEREMRNEKENSLNFGFIFFEILKI